MAPSWILLWVPWLKSTPLTTQSLKFISLKMGVDLLPSESYELLFFTSLSQNITIWESVTIRLSFSLIVTPKLGLVWLSDSSGMYFLSPFMFSIIEPVLRQFTKVWELTKRCSDIWDSFCSSPHRNRNGMASGLCFHYCRQPYAWALKPFCFLSHICAKKFTRFLFLFFYHTMDLIISVGHASLL